MKQTLSARHAISGILLIFATHIAIDYFTVYGTQLLAPFSRYGFAHANLFIIDPLYTIPLLAGVLIAAAANKNTGWRANAAGIAVSSLYILFSLSSHAYADHVFKEQLRTKNIAVIESITGATPMNTLLWRHIARTEEGLLIGYFSVIGDSPEDEIRFDFVPRNEHLIAPYRDQPNVRVIEWFSKGFWVAEKKENVLTLSDLRFGEFRVSENDSPDTWQYIFVWEIPDDPDTLLQRSRAIKDSRSAIRLLWRRLTVGI
jgi:inner membrane protein